MSSIVNLTTRQRRNAILEYLKHDDEVKVKNLAELFNVTGATVRTDLAEMEKEGLLQRVYGGAVSLRDSYSNMPLDERMKINRSEKISIAKACASLINDGDSLMIDSGTTTHYVARELLERNNLTVVTSAVHIAREFAYNNSIKVILLGGNLDSQYQFTYGPDAISQLHKYKADKMIMAVDGISAMHGLSTYHTLEADVSCLMIERSNTVIAVADYSKIGKEGFSYIAPLENIDILVTDKNALDVPALDEIRNAGIDVRGI